MALLGEVDAFADDVVATVFYLYDKSVSNFHPVANSNRVGASYATQAEVAFNFTIGSQPIVRKDGVPTAGILDD
jgi:hypothetical protein